MGYVSGYNVTRNHFGAIVYEAPQSSGITNFTQLFLTREIWGVDTDFLNRGRKLIPADALEEVFLEALPNYLNFAAKHLNLSFPIEIEAGLIGIKGYTIASNLLRKPPNAIRDHIFLRSSIGEGKTASEILGPFFDKVWTNCVF